MEAVIPTAIVEMSGCTSCMVSCIARPAEIEPPGELMYIWMSRSGSSRARYSSCAMIMFDDLVVDRHAKEYDAFLQQQGVDVIRTLAARRLLDDHWNDRS